MKGKINIYDFQGHVVYTIQGLININHSNNITTITYQDENQQTRTVQTNMPYIYWQD